MALSKIISCVFILFAVCNIGVQSLDAKKEAEVDVDLRSPWHPGQFEFPQEWKRELMAETALSRLDAAGVLAPGSRSASSFDPRLYFRSSGYYEGLLNMARITSFQMHNEKWPISWSMWGVEKSINAVASASRYATHRKAATGYPWEFGSSKLAQARMAFVMAAKWDVDLKGEVSFYDKPFYNIKETVQAIIKLKDPTSYFQDTHGEGERILHYKLIKSTPPMCKRQISIYYAQDEDHFSPADLLGVRKMFNDLEGSAPHSDSTVNSAWGGAKDIPSGKLSILDLVDMGIQFIRNWETTSDTMRARVLIIISKFAYTKSNEGRAKKLWDQMRSFSIEPFFVSVGSIPFIKNRDARDLLHLVNGEAWRGIVSESNDSETVRLMSRRLLRLICQAASDVSGGVQRQFFVNDRVLLYQETTSTGRRIMNIECQSRVDCSINMYIHPERFVNELFHNSHLNVTVPYQSIQEHSFESKATGVHVLLVAELPCLMKVRILQA